MPERTPFVGGNWKMNLARGEAEALARAVAGAAGPAEVVVFPPFPWLLPVADALAGRTVGLGGQDLFPEPNGAFTGEVSAAMLRETGCDWVLTGHSERRHVIGETDAVVAAKTRAALAAGLRVVLCVGETLDQREAGTTDAVVLGQLRATLDALDRVDPDRLVVAYEPVWAIGTGRTASPADAQAVHAAIRAALRGIAAEAADARIVYGGSVKPGNAAELAAEPDIDGFLVGGASLVADDFLRIIDAAGRRVGAPS